ncbi:D-glycerate dehydrogenase [Thermoanaerobacter brockii subsp. lactiethylicus]|uniref:D-isomer specific 2-hydroxyacid dehydrogenase, NAD-binding n=2 Tax=Thermoanaerobacter TaxID=1754 RepID=B0K7B2_THEP3|nr:MULTISPECIES: D-glycerate dehydrogenase [Thermoanaerobacter]ABY94259.1 D-isomer specific 2-hydroxyacid dehydrogenase, NAD-binding [Thermoanaerobacter pseudethanolicus ATCC 33223]ADV79212.1 D-isomer specific 2-hydroxyacid dehydrogenase NAD-binding protein [Thermoanaerobacter brockii subsp. finnii Ako-1]HBW60530.1 D-glycerate dehydrogenase [Thermoanaerobacter sp.]
MFKVYVTRMIPEEGIELLKKYCEVEINPEDRPLKREELLDVIKDKDAVVTQLNEKVDAEFFDSAKNLKIVANYAVGFDNIDLKEATKRKIYVTNTPDVLTNATAELAWALLFAAARRVIEADKFTREGKFTGWAPNLFLGKAVTGKTLGVIGAGRIGQAFAKMSKGFDMKILYTANTPKEEFEKETGAKYVDLETLLKESDFVSLHVPLTPHTRHLIGEKELKLMKKTAILINTARGPVVDEKALVNALKNKDIYAAGLDVYEKEPEITEELKALDNVVILPHIGSATDEARRDMAVLVAQNIIDVIEGRTPRTLVNKDILEK